VTEKNIKADKIEPETIATALEKWKKRWGHLSREMLDFDMAFSALCAKYLKNVKSEEIVDTYGDKLMIEVIALYLRAEANYPTPSDLPKLAYVS
jgi:hypothetical protein